MYVAESKRLTHQGAKKIMATAVDMASEAGIAISCAIVDAGGHMILLERMDGGRFHTVHSRTTKAVCAASNKRPTSSHGAQGQALDVAHALGLALAAGRTGQAPLIRSACALYSSFVRAVPVVTFVLLIYFGLPRLGLALNPLPAAILALVLNTAAFNCEIWRAAIRDFPSGQLEAARAFGMTRRVAFWRVVFPQIWRASLPSLVNEMTLLIKASPAIAIIGVVDLTRKARQIAAVTYEPYLGLVRDKPESGKLIADSLQYPMVFDTFGCTPKFIKENPKAVKALVESYFQALDMIAKDKTKAFTIMGADVKQTAEQFEQSQSKLKWADREANKKFFSGEIQAFNKEAAALLLEIGVIKTQPANMDTLFDTSFLN